MLTPLAKRIIVKPVKVSHGTLIITSQKPAQYQILQVGDDVTRVKAGDIVYIDQYSGKEIEHDKEKFLVIEESAILAKVSLDIP
jgi:chaperonin GroES